MNIAIRLDNINDHETGGGLETFRLNLNADSIPVVIAYLKDLYKRL